ncbi:hypothetical protein JCM30471_34700 [Desulfuromonas carbonis]|uniref:hypothetical protein n=1 Tax=Desulfuromonas sp. DDH964 TaxID=1823759 RepID=UPI00078E795B|nr:hypothetical protein [Desulfuromonas sp. DDH964]AMV72833.1 hypothetical protein DBW_2503 [Desulfuromonas sp. DDH964]
MAQILHLHCRYCGERLKNRSQPYCPACNLYLCYRAMPILLGMVLTGHLAPDLANVAWALEKIPSGYDDDNALIME